MDLKPIVKGCKAIIIHSQYGNDGKEVTVGECVGEIKFVDQVAKDKIIAWWIRPELPTNHGKRTNRIPEYQLMRIDGFDPSEELEEQDELVKEKTD